MLFDQINGSEGYTINFVYSGNLVSRRLFYVSPTTIGVQMRTSATITSTASFVVTSGAPVSYLNTIFIGILEATTDGTLQVWWGPGIEGSSTPRTGAGSYINVDEVG